MLTQKQKENRAYYAKHAEEIRAKKREAYWQTKDSNPTKTPPAPKPVPEKPKVSKPKISKPVITKRAHKEKALKKLEARRRIEDKLLAEELGIESF